jgi:hypothetical protein
MHPLLAAIALAAGVAVLKALTDGPPNDDHEWHAFLEVHTELHA